MKDKIGFRIFKDFKRPASELVEKFRGIPSSNIADLLNRLACMRHELNPMNDNALLGVAFTVKAPMGDNLMLHLAMDLAKPGDIIVVDGEGCVNRSRMGEMMVSYSENRGIGGLIIDGAIRDVDAARASSIPIYAKAVTPQGPFKHGPGEINVPIACAGQVVFPGDILVGDSDGIVVISPRYAEALAIEAAAKHQEEVNELASRIRETDPEEMEKRHRLIWDKLAQEMDIQYRDFVGGD
jgi:regulator of RNase E activity RraA